MKAYYIYVNLRANPIVFIPWMYRCYLHAFWKRWWGYCECLRLSFHPPRRISWKILITSIKKVKPNTIILNGWIAIIKSFLICPDSPFAQRQFRHCLAQCKNSYFAQQLYRFLFCADYMFQQLKLKAACVKPIIIIWRTDQSDQLDYTRT